MMIERGRWQRPKLAFANRTCTECGVIEDEFHVILVCKRYSEWRQIFLPISLYENPNMYCFINFLNNAKANEIRSLGIFCFKLFAYYNSTFLLCPGDKIYFK